MSATQLATKLLLSLPLIVALVLVWRSRLDLGQLGGGLVGEQVRRYTAWIERREPNAVYQNGTLVGRVEGVEIDVEAHVVRFHAMYETAPLEIRSPLAFREHTIRPRAIEALTAGVAASENSRRVYHDVTCEILG